MEKVQQYVASRMNGMANMQHVAEETLHEIENDPMSNLMHVLEYRGMAVLHNHMLFLNDFEESLRCYECKTGPAHEQRPLSV